MKSKGQTVGTSLQVQTLHFTPCLLIFKVRSLFHSTKLMQKQDSTESWTTYRTPDHLLSDSAPNIGPLISRWELDKFKNCWNKSFRTSKILTLLYQQFSNLLISQRDMSGPRLGALSNNKWSGGSFRVAVQTRSVYRTIDVRAKPDRVDGLMYTG